MEVTAEDKVLKAFKRVDLNGNGSIEEAELTELLEELDGTFSQSDIEAIIHAADFNKDGRVQYEEFVAWIFGMEGVGLADVGFEALLEKLLSVEQHRQAQDTLADALQTQGACMIVTVAIDEPDNIRMLTVLKYMRALFAMRIWNDEVRLVKSDGNRFFIFGFTAGKVLRAAFSMQLLVAQLQTWIGDICPDLGPLRSPATMKMGIHDGGILLIEGDCFGDPVNVSSKLGEDLAQPGEMLISATSATANKDEDMQALTAKCKLDRRQTEISGLTLDYYFLEPSDVSALVPPLSVPSSAEIEAHLQNTGTHGVMETSSLVIMVTDMSGFTKLTKKYGILHFLRLVLKARSIMLPAMAKVGGKKIKYEGDNIIASFPNVDVAVSCIKSCKEQIAVYNENREKDFQIRMGFALDVGEVTLLGHDVVGDTFDCSFLLAEDIAEVGEVLVSKGVVNAGWPSTPDATLSEERTLEEGRPGEKYHALGFK